MLVVVALFELRIEYAQSLKDKRMVVRSLKDRLRARFEASVSEVGLQDVHQRARIAVAFIAHDHPYADATLDKIGSFVESNTDATVAGFTSEKLEFDENADLI
ncbi:MAG TPA: DUF503 domain-containing protein [Thermoanaerobaculia bacterium]|nr:DUF503 domain-containing protein [Thermoanaerobaculia bacterium]